MTSNIEGLSEEKEHILSDFCNQYYCDILCLQETNRGNDNSCPTIAGMKLMVETPYRQYGSAIFTRTTLEVSSVKNDSRFMETITVELSNCHVTCL